MLRSILRLITAIVLPTLIASIIFLCIPFFLGRPPQVKEAAIVFVLYLGYGTMLWALPGSFLWFITESLWKANDSFRRPVVFAGTCGVLGLVGGLSLNLIAWLIWGGKISFFSTGLFGLVGAVASAITAAPLRKLHRPTD